MYVSGMRDLDLLRTTKWDMSTNNVHTNAYNNMIVVVFQNPCVHYLSTRVSNWIIILDIEHWFGVCVSHVKPGAE
jgi:hypothetical protein